MRFLSDSVINFFDNKLEKYGTAQGLMLAERRMKHIRFDLLRSIPESLLIEILEEQLEEFEGMLRKKRFLKADETIGAYKVYHRTLTIFIVNRIGKVKLM